MKLNGEYFIAPRSYTNGPASMGFYWPSRTPVAGRPDGQPYPEQGRAAQEVTIEIFLRSTNIPTSPDSYALIEMAEKNDWIASRTILRPGLDAVTMKSVIGPRMNQKHCADWPEIYIELAGVLQLLKKV